MIGRSASAAPFSPNRLKAAAPPRSRTPRMASRRLSVEPALSKNSFCSCGYLRRHIRECIDVCDPLHLFSPLLVLLSIHVPRSDSVFQIIQIEILVALAVLRTRSDRRWEARCTRSWRRRPEWRAPHKGRRLRCSQRHPAQKNQKSENRMKRAMTNGRDRHRSKRRTYTRMRSYN